MLSTFAVLFVFLHTCTGAESAAAWQPARTLVCRYLPAASPLSSAEHHCSADELYHLL